MYTFLLSIKENIKDYYCKYTRSNLNLIREYHFTLFTNRETNYRYCVGDYIYINMGTKNVITSWCKVLL